MLLFFLNRQDVPEKCKLTDGLSSLKKRIASGNYGDPFSEFNRAEDAFGTIKEWALARNDEELANSQVVFKEYFRLFGNLAAFFNCLSLGEYRASWDSLQDCLDCARFVGRFAPIDRRLDIPDIVELLENYEQLYPFSVFFSTEFVITKSHCSICGESMQSLSCPHRRNQLYRGEIAMEIVDEIRELQAVCLVNNPEDKKCVLESINGKSLSFRMLEDFLNLNLPKLQCFSIEKTVERKFNQDLKNIGRNSPCICGSGMKFKKCCGKNPYYDQLHCKVLPGKLVNLVMM